MSFYPNHPSGGGGIPPQMPPAVASVMQGPGAGPYSIGFAVETGGKRIATTKRKIRWRFGFPNREALERGLTGTNCRGCEHEVIVLWSVSSGKRQIMMDGQEVHYCVDKSPLFQFSWGMMHGNHLLRIICHATPPSPASSPSPPRQYDLVVDGKSFFEMQKPMHIGFTPLFPTTGGRGTHSQTPQYYQQQQPQYQQQQGVPPYHYGTASQQPYDTQPPQYSATYLREQQEQMEIQQAVTNNIEQSRRHIRRHR